MLAGMAWRTGGMARGHVAITHRGHGLYRPIDARDVAVILAAGARVAVRALATEVIVHALRV